MAVKRDVMEAIASGYALKTIWEHMRETGRLKCSYETFRKHVKRYIKGAVNELAEKEPGEAEKPVNTFSF
jgi:creatinine amidohydrolase/Fe(II)-dependent formamide hydrolase-like protein